MLRAFITGDPISYGKTDDLSLKWFFDKSVWQKMFRSMSGCGLNAMVLDIGHPSVVNQGLPSSEIDRIEHQGMLRWILDTTLDYDIAPYIAMGGLYDFSDEFSHDSSIQAVRGFLETFPDMVGLFLPAPDSDEIEDVLFRRSIEALDAARPDAPLYVYGLCVDSETISEKAQRRAGRAVYFSAPYSYDHFVDSEPDPAFSVWIDEVGAQNVMAELRFANFDPWSCFSYETVEGVLANLDSSDCAGFMLHPISERNWPRSTDEYFKFGWQRDLVFYSMWGGASMDDLLAQGNPKWLLRNHRIVPGFAAGSQILEVLALYFGLSKTQTWRPQFCMTCGPGSSQPHLFSISDMLRPTPDGASWWQEITGDASVDLAEYIKSGTPEDAYGPDELLEELIDLSQQAVEAGEKGIRSASGEKELPGFARDALCMGRLGEFYVERLRSALAHARGDNQEALSHLTRALGLFKEIASIERSHRKDFIISLGDIEYAMNWYSVVDALERELKDAAAESFKPGTEYPIA